MTWVYSRTVGGMFGGVGGVGGDGGKTGPETEAIF